MVAMAIRANGQGIEEIRQQIRKAGIRATPARIATLQLLRAATPPLTHADLSDRIVPLGFDKATVFRNLSHLTEVGLAYRTEPGDHVWRFEAVDPDDAVLFEFNKHLHGRTTADLLDNFRSRLFPQFASKIALNFRLCVFKRLNKPRHF